MDDFASWHPAFRPNSLNDLAPTLPTKPDHSSSPKTSIPPPQSQHISQSPIEETPICAKPQQPSNVVSSRDEDAPEPVATSAIDTSTSPAPSEGSLQADSKTNAQQHQQAADRFRETDIPQAVKFGIPQEAPADKHEEGITEKRSGISPVPLDDDAAPISAHDNKHISTMSFTRTAGIVDFGEGDEIDSEWNLNPPQSDPWRNMTQTARTNSFPAVPVSDLMEPEQIQPLHANEAEDIMHEVEQETRDMFADEDDVEDAFFTRPDAIADVTANDSMQSTFGEEPSSFGQAYGGVTADLEADVEDRFDEGVPLVQAQEEQAFTSNLDTAFGDEDGDDFFSKNTRDDDGAMPPAPLERKSTSQVLDSIHYQPRQALEDTIEESNLAVQPPAEEDSHEADKWKALLEEDDLLDDDDLLPDDDDEVLPVNSQTQELADLFGSDDEGFLDDDDEAPNTSTPPLTNGHSNPQADRPLSSDRYAPMGFQAQQSRPSNPYAPPVLQDISKQAPNFTTPFAAPAPGNFQPPHQPRPNASKAQSFADKSKGGYASPYDLPMDVVKPRKRPAASQAKTVYAAPIVNAPPPRSSNINDQRAASDSLLSPPLSANSNQAQLQNNTPSQPEKTVRKTQSAFFEDLPMTLKPKQALRHASSFVSQSGPSMQPPPRGASPYAPIQNPPQSHAGLVAPERVSPYASIPSAPSAVPPVASRYSPAPQQPSQSAPIPPPTNARYSPAPPAQKSAVVTPIYAPPPPLPHMPRTSSPLAQFERRNEPSQLQEPSGYERRASSNYESTLRNSHLPPTDELDESNPSGPIPPPASMPQTPPPPRSSSRSSLSPGKRRTSGYAPQPANGPPSSAPPQRSMTQSPGSLSVGGSSQRASSIEPPASSRALGKTNSSVPIAQNRPRGFSTGMNYIAPTDGREKDPLQRWRGSPVFFWGVGGSVVTSFPQDVPRYAAGQTIPMVIRSPGEVKIRNVKDVNPLPERLSSFPGPLKGKSKKKEVVTWLSAGINILEQDASYLRSVPQLTHEDKRVEERVILWKILRIFIENDGVLEGNSTVDKAVRDVLSPDVEKTSASASPLYATGASLSGITATGIGSRPDPADAASVEALRKHLLQGDREKAVWEAVDKQLWAHALLIANTVSRELYKQVAQEFVQKEVKSVGQNTESLAALYDVFSGNFEEIVDELVPPSARAGFQMISTSKTPAARDALEGLDRWRETLGLVLSNRSPDDSLALNALGKLLSGYGRAEAAHICFLFARTHTVFGGIDDPAVNVVLVGADHLRQPYDFDKELEPILLSETFEYGLSLSSTANVPLSAHLSVYKLQHATILAENGFRDKAIQYCDSINASITAQTRRSPYHHVSLTNAIEDLYKRLKQSPQDAKSSWIKKPTIDKVSGSLLASFNKFVAGGDGDETASNDSGVGSTGDIGPFAMIAGGTPNISRSPSKTELYGLSANGANFPHASSANSRYAPGAQYAPSESHSTYGSPTSGIAIPQAASMNSRYAPSGPYDHQGSYNSQPQNSFDGRTSGEYGRQQGDYRPTSQQSNSYAPSIGFSPYSPQDAFTPGPYQPQLSTPITEEPKSSLSDSPEASHSFDVPPPAFSQSSSRNVSESYSPPNYSSEAHSGYQPYSEMNPTIAKSQPVPFEPVSTGYEAPPSGYVAPAYVPYEPETEAPESPEDKPKKKKSFMDDDDDDDIPALRNPPRSSSTASAKSKAEKDREAEEAFRKAAEADAARDAPSQASAPKKGWGLSGWFGGGGAKKETTPAPEQHAPNKPIRAKLGEQSSFVYDEQLKRWVNKKAGAEDTAVKTATPPPPKASGPPRSSSTGPPLSVPRPMSSSSMTGPPTFGGQRVASDSSPLNPSPLAQLASSDLAPPMARQGSNSSSTAAPPTLSRPGSVGPPLSRPGTGMSNASSIDDLLGPAMIKGGKKAAGSSAAGGTSRGRKKGRGYVDLMAGGAPTPVGGEGK